MSAKAELFVSLRLKLKLCDGHHGFLAVATLLHLRVIQQRARIYGNN
jgi:hypothetical protein